MPRLLRTRVEVEGRWSDQVVVVEGEDLKPWGDDLRVVGAPIDRVDGMERARGQVIYTQDLRLPGTWHARIVRSPHAHARIVSIDASAALALPGVHGILTHENAPPIPWYQDSSLFDPHLRYAGEEVAAVLAETPEAARAAIAAIRVAYEPLPAVTDPLAALAPGAPVIAGRNNRLGGAPSVYTRGDLAAGLAGTRTRVDMEFTTAAALHNALEPHGTVARWEGDRLVVWDSTQFIFGIRAGLAEKLGLPLNHVRVIKQAMGGGFGAKNSVRKYMVIAALFARSSGRPVRCVLDRVEENLCVGHRHATAQRLTLAADRRGRLTAVDGTFTAAVGGHGAGMMPVGGPARELYACPAVRTEEVGVRVNLGPHTAFRAPGYVEGTFALECALDELARRLGLDPFEIRRRNVPRVDPVLDVPCTRPTFRAALDEAERRSRRWTRRPRQTGDLRRGRGVAAAIWGVGGGPPAQALAQVQADGTLTILCGTQDLGTGTRTVLAQVAAEAFGISMDRVSVVLGDTGVTPHAPASWGSITVASTAPAVRQAADDARRQVLELGRATLGAAAARRLSFDRLLATLSERLGPHTLTGRGTRWPNPEGYRVAAYAVHVVELVVDIITGEIRVERAVCVHDCGRVLNPKLARNQVEGGFLQGLGFALMEERRIDPLTHRSLNPSLLDYKVPTVRDLPVIETVFLPGADRKANNVGAVGLGEPPIIPVAAAIGNALADALGVRLTDTPFTPQRVLDALAAADARSAEAS